MSYLADTCTSCLMTHNLQLEGRLLHFFSQHRLQRQCCSCRVIWLRGRPQFNFSNLWSFILQYQNLSAASTRCWDALMRVQKHTPFCSLQCNACLSCPCAGISCAGVSASHSAILKASELQPHFCGFIHRGGLAFVDDPPPNPTAPSKSAEMSESALAALDKACSLNVTRRATAQDKSMLPALYASTNGCNYYNIYRSYVASKL